MERSRTGDGRGWVQPLPSGVSQGRVTAALMQGAWSNPCRLVFFLSVAAAALMARVHLVFLEVRSVRTSSRSASSRPGSVSTPSSSGCGTRLLTGLHVRLLFGHVHVVRFMRRWSP